MIPEFAELVVTLGSELDAAQKTMLRLTWAVIVLTVVMLLVGIAQLYVSVYPASNQPPSTKNVPHSDAPKNEGKPIESAKNK
jgi:cell division protein FtsN